MVAWGGLILLIGVAAAMFGEWVPLAEPYLRQFQTREQILWAIGTYLWPVAGSLYLVACCRLFVAYWKHLRLPHAVGVVVGTRAIVLLVLVGLHVACWTLAGG